MSTGGPLHTDSYFDGKLRRDHSRVETEISERITEKRQRSQSMSKSRTHF